MKSAYIFAFLMIVCLHIQLPVDMFPANSGNERKLPNYDPAWESNKHYNVRGNIKVNEHYYNHVGISPTNKDEFHPISATSTLELNMKETHNVKHVAEFIMAAEHSKDAEKQPSLFGSSSQEHSTLNGGGNQAERIDLHDLKDQEGLNGLDPDLSTNQIKSVVSLPSRDSIDMKLEQVQKRLSNLTDNLTDRKIVFPTDYDRSSISTEQKILNDKQYKNRNENIGANPNTKLEQQSINEPKVDKYFHNKTPSGILTQGHVHDTFWADSLEKICSDGYSEDQYANWKVKVENHDVIRIEEGCGSMQNRLITFNDSTQACVRYRMNSEQMQGDIYSFYLSRLLTLDYTPPTTMVLMQKSKRWGKVWDEVTQAKWADNSPVIITKWVGPLEAVYMPEELKDRKRGIRPENYRLGSPRPSNDLCNLIQWSDLVLFDYISGNLDRVVNNMFNLKWNPRMLEKPIHNLERETTSDRLVFLDNESGLFHGYRLLDTYGKFHETLLNSVCVFRKSTIDAIEKLVQYGNVGEGLQQLYEHSELVHNYLPRIGKNNKSILKQRLKNVLDHVNTCRYQNNNSENYLQS